MINSNDPNEWMIPMKTKRNGSKLGEDYGPICFLFLKKLFYVLKNKKRITKKNIFFKYKKWLLKNIKCAIRVHSIKMLYIIIFEKVLKYIGKKYYIIINIFLISKLCFLN